MKLSAQRQTVASSIRSAVCRRTFDVTGPYTCPAGTVRGSRSIPRDGARADPRRRRRPRRAGDAALRLPAPRARRASSSPDLPADHDVRRYAEQKMELLDRLGHASSKADEGPRESPARPGWEQIPSAAPADSPLPRRRSRRRERPRHGRLARDRARDRAALRARRRAARRDRLPPQRRGGRGDGRGAARRRRRSRCSCAATSRRTACSRRCAALGPLDVLVHNAATGVVRTALETEDKHWDWTMNANARALPLARPRRGAADAGRLVDRRDLVARRQRVLENYALIGTSKAALESLVRYLAVELAPAIRVNAVSAGVVETGALEHFPNQEEMLARRRGEPGRAARRPRTTSPARSRSSARRTPRWSAATCWSSTAASR